MDTYARVIMRRSVQELRNQYIQGTHALNLAGIELFRHIFADFRKCAERRLGLVEVTRVHRLSERRQAIDPVRRLDDLHKHSNNLRGHIPQHGI